VVGTVREALPLRLSINVTVSRFVAREGVRVAAVLVVVVGEVCAAVVVLSVLVVVVVVVVIGKSITGTTALGACRPLVPKLMKKIIVKISYISVHNSESRSFPVDTLTAVLKMTSKEHTYMLVFHTYRQMQPQWSW